MTDFDQINKELFLKAVEAADPELLIPKFIPQKPKGKLIVIGCGKASAAMAKSFEENYDGDYSGIVVTNYGNNIQTKKIEIVEASHPLPDIKKKSPGCPQYGYFIQRIASDRCILRGFPLAALSSFGLGCHLANGPSPHTPGSKCEIGIKPVVELFPIFSRYQFLQRQGNPIG